MNAQTLIKETLCDIDEAPTPRNAALAVANIEFTINIGKILEEKLRNHEEYKDKL